MRRLVLGTVVLLGAALMGGRAAGQDTPRAGAVEIRVVEEGVVQELRLLDGSVLYGRVTTAGDPFTFELVGGDRVTISTARVRSLERATGTVVEGSFYREDPNRTRLFIGPTGRTMPRGSGYFAVYELFIPFLSFAPSDHVIISGGTPIMGGIDPRPVWIAPKIRVFGDGRTDFAVGVFAFTALNDESDASAGLLYGVLTHGTPKAAVTAALGYGFYDGDLAETPTIMLGGEVRVARSAKIVTENYLLPGGDLILSLGPRFFGERLSADVGLAFPVSADDDWDTFVFPLVNFVYNWG